jgi:uncharacterized protein DUF4189
VFDNKCDVRTSFLAIALTCFLAAIVHAQENTTMEISRSSYAAIAYSPATGKYAYASDYRSRPAAEKAALAKCGAEDAVIACWVNWGFCALALGSDKSCWGVGWQYGGGANNHQARDRALEDCRNRTTGVYTAIILSSDGQYVWDSKDHTIIIDNKGNIRDGHGNIVTPTPSATASASERSDDKK